MFPIKDSIKSYSNPTLTYLIIFVNLVVFIFELFLPPKDLELFIYENAVIPLRFISIVSGEEYITIKDFLVFIYSIFLHGGWVHIIGNMWTLWIFGDNVEDTMGRLNFLLFYLFSGIFASLMHIVINPYSHLPIIGASGAIAGVMGAYFYFFPHSTILIMIPIIIFPIFIEVPAIIFLAFWFLQQTFNGALSLAIPNFEGGIAWWAHIGGFIFGYVYARIFFRRVKLNADLYYF